MVLDVGRIKHRGDLMHKSIGSNGSAVPSNWKLSADGLTNVVWTPESPSGTPSFGSNSNEVSYTNAPGASTDASRADHVHRGVTSLAHSSNTLTGPVELQTEGSLYIVRPAGTQIYKLGSTGTGGGAGVSYGSNSNEVSYENAPGASSLVSRADHVHRGVTSLSHASNTYTGPVTLETEGGLYIVRSAANTYRFGSSGGAGGGGASTVYLAASSIPDTAPGGGSDQEWNSTTIGGTAVGTATTEDADTTFDSHYYVKKAATASVALTGRAYSWSPSAGGIATCKLTDSAWFNVANMRSGFFAVAEASPGIVIAVNYLLGALRVDKYTNPTTYNGFINQVTEVGAIHPVYLRFRYNSSTSVDCLYSFGGSIFTLLANFNPGFTVGAVVVGVDPEQATRDGEAMFDWIRFA